MAAWLWLKGIPGPPQNDEWFELLRWSLGGQPTASSVFGGSRSAGVEQVRSLQISVPYDSRSAAFFQALANNQIMELVSVFVEPQRQYVFSRCSFQGVSSGEGNNAPLVCSIAYESVAVQDAA